MKKVVLITGGARGIGEEISKAFSEKGYIVAINYFKSKKRGEKLFEDIKKMGNICNIFYADVSKEEEVEKMFEEIEKKLGFVDVLVNNAGITQSKLFLDLTKKDWQNIINVNLLGTVYCCKKVLKNMIRNKKGKIINISSIWGVVGGALEVSYSSSKAAVIGFTKALAKEVAPSGINVNCVAPGVIKTDMLAGLNEKEIEILKNSIPIGRIGSAADVAKAVLFLASESSDYITGEVLNVGGGFGL